MHAAKLAILSLGLTFLGLETGPAQASACYIDAEIAGQKSVTCIELTPGMPAAGPACDVARAARGGAAMPGARIDYRDMPACPADHKGGCKPSRGPATVFYYDQAAADMARQSCNDRNPVMPGTWVAPKS